MPQFCIKTQRKSPQNIPLPLFSGALAHLQHPASYRKLGACVQFSPLISPTFRIFRPVFDAKLRLRTPILHQIPRLCSFQTRILHPILHPKGPVNTGGCGYGCRKCRRFLQNFFRKCFGVCCLCFRKILGECCLCFRKNT